MAFRTSASTVLFICMLPGTSLAQDSMQEVVDQTDSVELIEEQAPDSLTLSSAASPFDANAIDETTLSAVSGREDTTQVSYANQVAGVTRNSVGDNAVTGDARIDGNAFQNLSGLSILNVNTGNNVAINAAMNVNISIQPGT